jgi:glucose-6-phosphate isomerase
MSANKVGRFGFKQSELNNLGKKLKAINAKLEKNSGSADLSFRKLPYQAKFAAQISQLVKGYQRKFDTLVLVGIGGSDLGARAICNALGQSKYKVYFTGDTTDPDSMSKILAAINFQKTLFYVISKSGETLEPMVDFLFLRDLAIKKLGYKNQAQHFLITTNTEKGKLWEIAKREGYHVLAHYPGGGRFSVLSINGLLPAAWLGIDISQLLLGAKAIDQAARKNNWQQNLAFIYAALHYLGYKKRKQNLAVLMPYSENLDEFAFWYRQLLAESLGKKYNLNNKMVEIGLTPIAAFGPRDQHSQLQIYNEGTNDKLFTFIKINNFRHDYKVPALKNSGFEYVAGTSFSRILQVEQQAVANSLMKNKRANATLSLPQLDEYYLGQLFQFFEMAVVYLGELFQINVFDQPGVEESKKMMVKLLKK